ncbi:hypothetical protein KR52_00770 [Synechococcus sp. KORDI-52]|uniref:hypothetical protein n=1 Tax=Synechococcus sp. KORDI-52 TaxID=585425 RepID=UPI0004E07AB4|nr:hypothetical protein [Synechococcus sp. KORDI-52]AII47705.1 hypothetical protein KR52_00770 [Synechococcus sp. KORDI-52]
MRRPGLKSIWAVLLAAVLLLGAGLPVHAGLGFFHRDGGSGSKPLPSSAPSGKLQEVAPPGAVQQLRQNLQRHRPSLRLIDPGNDSIVFSDALELRFEIDDWPLSSDPELGLGPHVVLQIDNRAPLRLSESNGNRLKVRIDDLEAGSHRFSAWAAYPWGEAVQAPGASIQGRLHLWQKLQGTQPERDAPWLVPVSPTGEQGLQPLLVDWLIWNAPLQNLREGDGRWRLRISIDGDSFLVDHQEALWLKESNGAGSHDLQMELLNGLGEPITPVFNNQLIHLKSPSGPKPGWMRPRLTESQLARLSGSPEPEVLDVVESTPEPPQKTDEKKQEKTKQPRELPQAEIKTEDKVEDGPQPTAPEESDGQEPEPPLAEEPSTAEAALPTPAEEKPAEPQQPAEQDSKLMPSSSLGGSARELLNSDGRLRQP